MSDNHKGFFPDLTEDEMAAMPYPPRSLHTVRTQPSPMAGRPDVLVSSEVEYYAQADGDLLRAAHAFPRADLERVLAFVERHSALLPGEEPPAHVHAAARLLAWLEGQA